MRRNQRTKKPDPLCHTSWCLGTERDAQSLGRRVNTQIIDLGFLERVPGYLKDEPSRSERQAAGTALFWLAGLTYQGVDLRAFTMGYRFSVSTASHVQGLNHLVHPQRPDSLNGAPYWVEEACLSENAVGMLTKMR